MNLADDPLILLIQEKIASEQAAAAESKRLADVTEAANQLLTRERERDTRRTGLLMTTVDRYAGLSEQIKELLSIIEIERKEQSARRGIDREFHNTLSERIDDIEQGLFAVLTRDLAEMRRARGAIGGRLDRRAELATLHRNLEKLRNQAAKHGPLNIPLSISNAIEETERKIEEIKGQ